MRGYCSGKVVEAMVEENEKKEKVLANQMKESVSELDDKLIEKMIACEEMM